MKNTDRGNKAKDGDVRACVVNINFSSRIDFTGCGIFVFVSLIVLMIFGILALIFRSQVRLVYYFRYIVDEW